MSAPYIASTLLVVVGTAVGSLPFIAGLRRLPRWIRVAKCLVGITFITGGMLGFGLYSVGNRISYRLHMFVFFHITLLVGMGLGVILLVLVSGEYFNALHALDAARRERLAGAAQGSASENV